MNINNYLDEAKAKTGSDYATAKALRVTPQTICMARKSGSTSVELCRRLAELLNIEPWEIIIAGEIAKHPERAKDWKKWVKVASILLAANLPNSAIIQDVRASTGIEQFIHYANLWQLGSQGLGPSKPSASCPIATFLRIQRV